MDIIIIYASSIDQELYLNSFSWSTMACSADSHIHIYALPEGMGSIFSVLRRE